MVCVTSDSEPMARLTFHFCARNEGCLILERYPYHRSSVDHGCRDLRRGHSISKSRETSLQQEGTGTASQHSKVMITVTYRRVGIIRAVGTCCCI